MRINLPVTQREYPFPAGETLVSTTDLQGRILYCNTAFVQVSGYARDELLGQPHNMIRHPDMPAEAFRDMWQTIQQGHPWSALVKNRRKDGDHYWVRANVTPLADASGALVGFMSVRTQPEKAEVAAAEALYAQLRAEAEGGRRSLGLHRGQVLPLNGPARWWRLLRPGLRGKLTGAAGLVGAVGFVLGEYQAGGLAHIESEEILIGLVAVGACASLGGWYLKRLVAEPVSRLVDFANQIAGGNLTQDKPAAGRDEIGHMATALQQLNVNLMSIVRDARNGVSQLREGTGSIAAGNRDLSARTESQASSLEQTAASMEQITATLRQNVDMAAEAAGRADDACAVAARSGAQVQALAEVMGRIDAASRKVNEIIQVVDGIAFQTNILALNAAVEAARAGEHGRGFAVVASEVRSLSQRTTVAAREIRGLIQNTVEQIADGTRQTENAQAAMQQAQEAVVSVDGLIRQISSGMREQMLGVSQVSEAVSSMDTLTQQNAGLVAEISQSAQALNDQAGDVAQSVAVFQLPGQTSVLAGADAVSLRRQAKANRGA